MEREDFYPRRRHFRFALESGLNSDIARQVRQVPLGERHPSRQSGAICGASRSYCRRLPAVVKSSAITVKSGPVRVAGPAA
jgi:hypothetical protein